MRPRKGERLQCKPRKCFRVKLKDTIKKVNLDTSAWEHLSSDRKSRRDVIAVGIDEFHAVVKQTSMEHVKRNTGVPLSCNECGFACFSKVGFFRYKFERRNNTIYRYHAQQDFCAAIMN